MTLELESNLDKISNHLDDLSHWLRDIPLHRVLDGPIAAVFCINLDRRTDRWEDFQETFRLRKIRGSLKRISAGERAAHELAVGRGALSVFRMSAVDGATLTAENRSPDVVRAWNSALASKWVTTRPTLTLGRLIEGTRLCSRIRESRPACPSRCREARCEEDATLSAS